MNGIYDDILRLPHHTSRRHPHMPVSDRAAQFAPFAALTGYASAIREAARLTSDRIELGDDAKAALDEALRFLSERLSERPVAAVTYFQPDPRKKGGAYLTLTGAIKKIDTLDRTLLMEDGTRIPLDEIITITPHPVRSDPTPSGLAAERSKRQT